MKELFLGQKTNKRKELILRTSVLTGLIVFIILFPFGKGLNRFHKSDMPGRIALGESMTAIMSRLQRIGLKMQYAGADIENEMLEDIKIYVFSLNEMNDVCERAFGEEYTPIEKGFMRHLMSSVNELEMRYKKGENAAQAEKAVSEYLMKLSEICEIRFNDKSDILPFAR